MNFGIVLLIGAFGLFGIVTAADFIAIVTDRRTDQTQILLKIIAFTLLYMAVK